MSDLAEARSPVPSLLRDRSGVQRVTNIELFLDLVYVFAVTQLSHLIHPVMVAGIIVAASDRLPWLPRPAGSPGP